MDESDTAAFVKYNRFQMEQRPRYQPTPFEHASLHYNAKEDYYICPMGQKMRRVGTKKNQTSSGYTRVQDTKQKGAKAVHSGGFIISRKRIEFLTSITD